MASTKDRQRALERARYERVQGRIQQKRREAQRKKRIAIVSTVAVLVVAAGVATGFAVVGGARLTNESAYAWVKLAKGVVGSDHVDCQLGDGLAADVQDASLLAGSSDGRAAEATVEVIVAMTPYSLVGPDGVATLVPGTAPRATTLTLRWTDDGWRVWSVSDPT